MPVSAPVQPQQDQSHNRAYVRESSPRWLLIVRDSLISLVCLAILVATVLVVYGVGSFANDVSNSINGTDTSTSSPSPDPNSTGDPNDPNNVFDIPGTKEYCSIHPDNPTC